MITRVDTICVFVCVLVFGGVFNTKVFRFSPKALRLFLLFWNMEMGWTPSWLFVCCCSLWRGKKRLSVRLKQAARERKKPAD